MVRVPVATHAEIIATSFVIEIVVETAELPVLKSHPR
jgi:hypothetical protein